MISMGTKRAESIRTGGYSASENTDMVKWSVIACDQHTSEPEYWERVDRFVGSSPSTLRLMLPEHCAARKGFRAY